MEKIKLMTIVGTRPEIIRLSAVIKKCDRYFNQLLVHTGQNYDYTLNQIFFEDLELRAPDFYLNAVGSDLGETIGNIIAKSYALMAQQKPDALLILGDTNSCLSAIAAKRLESGTAPMRTPYQRAMAESRAEHRTTSAIDVVTTNLPLASPPSKLVPP
mgnify:CR=1 FL=1